MELIYQRDQKVRYEMGYYQNDSDEFKALVNKMNVVDSINLDCIKLYLNEFGYPVETNFSSLALKSPWIVLQHSLEPKNRRDYFKYIYSGYKSGVINESELWVFLNRSYSMEINFEGHPIESNDTISIAEKNQFYISELGYLSN